jgi:hypothetical protein
VLWLDHDPGLGDEVVRRARRARLRQVWRWHRDPHERAVAARRVQVAFWALRTEGLRRRVLSTGRQRWTLIFRVRGGWSASLIPSP